MRVQFTEDEIIQIVMAHCHRSVTRTSGGQVSVDIEDPEQIGSYFSCSEDNGEYVLTLDLGEMAELQGD